jgi:hypothetical protein
LVAGATIAVVAFADVSDAQDRLADSGKVGWGLWLDGVAGVVLALAALALLRGRREEYGRRVDGVAVEPPFPVMPPQPPTETNAAAGEVMSGPLASKPVAPPMLDDDAPPDSNRS